MQTNCVASVDNKDETQIRLNYYVYHLLNHQATIFLDPDRKSIELKKNSYEEIIAQMIPLIERAEKTIQQLTKTHEEEIKACQEKSRILNALKEKTDDLKNDLKKDKNLKKYQPRINKLILDINHHFGVAIVEKKAEGSYSSADVDLAQETLADLIRKNDTFLSAFYDPTVFNKGHFLYPVIRLYEMFPKTMSTVEIVKTLSNETFKKKVIAGFTGQKFNSIFNALELSRESLKVKFNTLYDKVFKDFGIDYSAFTILFIEFLCKKSKTMNVAEIVKKIFYGYSFDGVGLSLLKETFKENALILDCFLFFEDAEHFKNKTIKEDNIDGLVDAYGKHKFLREEIVKLISSKQFALVDVKKESSIESRFVREVFEEKLKKEKSEIYQDYMKQQHHENKDNAVANRRYIFAAKIKELELRYKEKDGGEKKQERETQKRVALQKIKAILSSGEYKHLWKINAVQFPLSFKRPAGKISQFEQFVIDLKNEFQAEIEEGIKQEAFDSKVVSEKHSTSVAKRLATRYIDTVDEEVRISFIKEFLNEQYAVLEEGSFAREAMQQFIRQANPQKADQFEKDCETAMKDLKNSDPQLSKQIRLYSEYMPTLIQLENKYKVKNSNQSKQIMIVLKRIREIFLTSEYADLSGLHEKVYPHAFATSFGFDNDLSKFVQALKKDSLLGKYQSSDATQRSLSELRRLSIVQYRESQEQDKVYQPSAMKKGQRPS